MHRCFAILNWEMANFSTLIYICDFINVVLYTNSQNGLTLIYLHIYFLNSENSERKFVKCNNNNTIIQYILRKYIYNY